MPGKPFLPENNPALLSDRVLRLYWPCPPVQWKGKGIAESWASEMASRGYGFTDNWQEADCAVFPSDSQLDREIVGRIPSICFFWGFNHRWVYERIQRHGQGDDEGFDYMTDRLDLLQSCQFVLAPSLITSYQLLQFGIEPILLAPGVDTRTLDKYRTKTTRSNSQVIFVSRLAPHKGLELLIAAMSLVTQRNTGVRLVVCGPGERGEYQKQAESMGVRNIEWLEPSDEEKVRLIESSALLVHPSNYEGFGLPPLEALYLGTPTAVLDQPWSRSLLQESALYFSTVEGLAATIVDVITRRDYADLRARTNRGQKMVAGYLNLARACQDLDPVIHEAIRMWAGAAMRSDPSAAEGVYDRDHRRNYFFKAQYYDPTWERHWRAARMIDALRKHGARTILDIGCGAIYPVIFARAGFMVTAFDLSGEALSQVREVAGKHGVSERIATVLGDAHYLPSYFETDDMFDAAVIGEMLEHVLDPALCLRNAVEQVKPGGVVLATTPVGHHHFDPLHIGPAEGGWDDARIEELLAPYLGASYEKIAEDTRDPSCYLLRVPRPEV